GIAHGALGRAQVDEGRFVLVECTAIEFLLGWRVRGRFHDRSPVIQTFVSAATFAPPTRRAPTGDAQWAPSPRLGPHPRPRLRLPATRRRLRSRRRLARETRHDVADASSRRLSISTGCRRSFPAEDFA